MAAPGKFDEEARARAVRRYADRLRDHGESELAAGTHVGGLLDINPATLRNWIGVAERTARPAGRRTIPTLPPSCGDCAKRTPSCAGRMRS